VKLQDYISNVCPFCHTLHDSYCDPKLRDAVARDKANEGRIVAEWGKLRLVKR
jgi:hypothetical protein